MYIIHNVGVVTFKSNSLHVTLYFEKTLCITVIYFYLEIKVTSNILKS